MLRILAGAAALFLMCAGLWLGYVAFVAARRSEGVFLPAGYVAALCLVGAGLLARLAMARAM